VVIGEGLVLTQYLVVEPGETHFVTDASGERWGAEVRAADPRSGLAVLRLVRAEGVDTEFPPTLPIGSAEELRRGSFVVAVGNPYAIEAEGGATVSWGVVSNIARKAPANENYNDVPDQNGAYRTTLHHFGTLLQTDAKLGWGAAGGALVDLDGSLVGITTTTSTIPGHESSAGYAIPMNATMRRVIDRLVEGREAEYGLLGVAFNPMATADPLGRPSGMVIDSAYQGSPAQRAGLRQGDVIVRVSGEPTPDADALQRVVGGIPPGTDAFVEFRRDNAMQQTKVRVGKAFVVGDRVVTKKQPAWRGMRVDFPTAVPPMILQQKAQQGLLDPAGCVVISEVEPDSVSWRSGVRPYMFVSHVGGDRVTSPDEFYRAVATAPQSVKLKFTEGVASPPINAAAGVPAEVPPPAPPVAPIVPPGWGRGLVPEQPAEADGAPDPVAPAFEPLSPRVEDEPGKPR
jgi:S1-C subfamily serine protease